MLTRLAMTAILMGAALTTTAAKADYYEHIDEVAYELQKSTTTLIRELHSSYRHTAEYPHLRSDALRLNQLARHVHEVAHSRGSIHHLRSDVEELDRAFHHLEEVIDRIEHEARRHNGHHHFGHVHGNTRYVRSLMRAIEDNLHHLRDDVNALWAASHRPAPVARAYNPRDYFRGAWVDSRGLVVRSPSFSIRLGR